MKSGVVQEGRNGNELKQTVNESKLQIYKPFCPF